MTASLELRPGATADRTLAAALAIERAGREAAASLPDPSGRDLVNAVYITVGQQESAGPGAIGALNLLQGNKASIVFELLDPEVRSISSGDFERRWRELAGSPPGDWPAASLRLVRCGSAAPDRTNQQHLRFVSDQT